MFPSEWAEWRGGELLNQLDNTPLLLPPAPPSRASPAPSQCDLICLVISGLACSAQLHSKVKLDKGIGASPCKTASPWQLLEWAADWSRVEEEGEEEDGGRGRWRNGVMKDDVPERKADKQLREAPSQEGGQWWRRTLFNVETKFDNNQQHHHSGAAPAWPVTCVCACMYIASTHTFEKKIKRKIPLSPRCWGVHWETTLHFLLNLVKVNFTSLWSFRQVCVFFVLLNSWCLILILGALILLRNESYCNPSTNFSYNVWGSRVNKINEKKQR